MKAIISKLPSLLAVASGVLLWLGLPGEGDLWPLLFVALIPFFLAVHHAPSSKKAALYGLTFGVIHYLLILYWIVIVLGQYGGLPIFISIPALIALAFYMALYSGAFAYCAHILMRRSSVALWIWVIPAIWVGNDWLRSFLFSGFPWMDIGYGLWRVPLLIQPADLFGHHILTFFLVLINGFCTVFLLKKKEPTVLKQVLVPVCVFVFVFIGYSVSSYQHTANNISQLKHATIGVVQGNILQNEKWSPEKRKRTVEQYITLTKTLTAQSPQLIVWPETAMPFYLNVGGDFTPVAKLIDDEQLYLLTGAPWYKVIDSEKNDIDYYNSALLLNSESRLIGKYYKNHLVPYGEYVPLKKYMPFLAPLVQTVGDFTPGTIETPLSSGDIKAGVLLCYESIFPEIGRKWSEKKANVLVNLTNDAWYGKSSAPYQSFAMTVLRAVETRKSVVRSANTGISGFIDPLGRVKHNSDIFVPWAKTADVVLSDHQTVFTKWGYLFGFLCFGIGYGSVLLMAKRKISSGSR